MKLYVANTTKQRMMFSFRVAESDRLRQIPIEPGSQRIVLDNASKDEIDSIIQHHQQYGMVESRSIDQTQQFIGTCYSIDKPVASAVIEKGMRDNDNILDRTSANRRQAALTAHDQSQQESGTGYRGDLEFQTEQAKDQHGQEVDGALSESISTGKGKKK